MKIAINKTHWPVTVLGYGRRVGIWLQGCSIGCKGCCSQDTWDREPARLIEVDSIVDWIESLGPSYIDGFTISGGEPFDQPDQLAILIRKIRTQFCSTPGRDVLVYSGYPFTKLKNEYSSVLALCDVIISGPYVHSLQTEPLRGSSNQEIHILSALGRDRYTNLDQWHKNSQLQFDYDGTNLSLIGIPARQDLFVLEKKLAAVGITIGEASWRS